MYTSSSTSITSLLLLLCLMHGVLVAVVANTIIPQSSSIASIQVPVVQVVAFAASKKGGGGGGKKKRKGKPSTFTGKTGFGQSNKPSIQEIAYDLNFPTRIPSNTKEAICPCGTKTPNTLYKDCCQPFHTNQDNIKPQSPMDVLKTRYSAFAYRMPFYIIDTTHPVCRDYRKDTMKWAKELNRDGMFDSYDFINLDAGEEFFKDDGEGIESGEGFIDFKVNLVANTNSGEHIVGQSIVVQERSRFLRTSDGGWKYAGGVVTADVGGLEGAVLNS